MLEDRLEAVERELIRLNKTLQDLITIYVDNQGGGLLNGIPKNDGYLPSFIKERDNIAKKKGKQTATSMRELFDYAINVLGIHTVESVLNNFNTKEGLPSHCLADVQPQDYKFLHAQLLERIPDEN